MKAIGKQFISLVCAGATTLGIVTPDPPCEGRQSICAIPPADQPHTDDEPPPPLPPMQKISATIVSSSIFVQTLLNRTAQSVVRWAGINKD
jgi:hypothetical protein